MIVLSLVAESRIIVYNFIDPISKHYFNAVQTFTPFGHSWKEKNNHSVSVKYKIIKSACSCSYAWLSWACLTGTIEEECPFFPSFFLFKYLHPPIPDILIHSIRSCVLMCCDLWHDKFGRMFVNLTTCSQTPKGWLANQHQVRGALRVLNCWSGCLEGSLLSLLVPAEKHLQPCLPKGSERWDKKLRSRQEKCLCSPCPQKTPWGFICMQRVAKWRKGWRLRNS